jgi:hypothetical protein
MFINQKIFVGQFGPFEKPKIVVVSYTKHSKVICGIKYY